MAIIRGKKNRNSLYQPLIDEFYRLKRENKAEFHMFAKCFNEIIAPVDHNPISCFYPFIKRGLFNDTNSLLEEIMRMVELDLEGTFGAGLHYSYDDGLYFKLGSIEDFVDIVSRIHFFVRHLEQLCNSDNVRREDYTSIFGLWDKIDTKALEGITDNYDLHGGYPELFDSTGRYYNIFNTEKLYNRFFKEISGMADDENYNDFVNVIVAFKPCYRLYFNHVYMGLVGIKDDLSYYIKCNSMEYTQAVYEEETGSCYTENYKYIGGRYYERDFSEYKMLDLMEHIAEIVCSINNGELVKERLFKIYEYVDSHFESMVSDENSSVLSHLLEAGAHAEGEFVEYSNDEYLAFCKFWNRVTPELRFAIELRNQWNVLWSKLQSERNVSASFIGDVSSEDD